MAGLLPACQGTSHKAAKLEAQQRWSDVRANVKLQLAKQQYESGLFENAERTILESIALSSTNPAAFVLLSQTNLELGKPASSWDTLEAARTVGLNSADLHYMRGVLLEQRGKTRSAIDEFVAARRLNSRHADALVAQAECLVALGYPVDALTLIEENLDSLDDVGTMATLGAHVAVLVGDVFTASQHYANAQEAGAKSRVLAEELGRLLVRAGRYEEALIVLRPLFDQTDPVELGGAVRRAAAICHLALGDPVSAKAVLIDFARSHPKDTVAQLLLAKSAIAVGDTMTALQALDLAEKHSPNQPEVLLVRATVRWERGDTSGAAADLYDVLAKNPEDVEAHCLLGEVLRTEQHFEAARIEFLRALEIDPDCAWATAGLKSMRVSGMRQTAHPTTALTSHGAKVRLSTQAP